MLILQRSYINHLLSRTNILKLDISDLRNKIKDKNNRCQKLGENIVILTEQNMKLTENMNMFKREEENDNIDSEFGE